MTMQHANINMYCSPHSMPSSSAPTPVEHQSIRIYKRRHHCEPGHLPESSPRNPAAPEDRTVAASAGLFLSPPMPYIHWQLQREAKLSASSHPGQNVGLTLISARLARSSRSAPHNAVTHARSLPVCRCRLSVCRE
jgi:hypothetical protein